MITFISTSEAYRVARERASVAAAFEDALLHLAVYDAREEGMSVRETATALRVPKSTVARHWRVGHRCRHVMPLWGSPAAWTEAHAAIWAHNPHELADDRVPYRWFDNGECRTVLPRRGEGVTPVDPAAGAGD